MSYWDELKNSGANRIIIDEGIREIPSEVFRNLEAEEVVLPNSLVSIGFLAFQNASIKRITFPEGFRHIGLGAFHLCKNLEEVVFPNSLETISIEAFQECDSLTSIVIPYVNKIKSGAFRNCQSLKSVTIKEGLTKIESQAFYGCSNLKNVTLCDGIKKIEDSCFGSTAIDRIFIPDSVNDICDSAFASCTQLKEIYLSENLTRISSTLFKDCKNLRSLVIPESVEEIEIEAFRGCGITEIRCPSSVKAIHAGVFFDCKDLKKIEFLGDININESFFNDNRIFNDIVPLTELSISAKSLLTVFDLGWISKHTLEKLIVDDFVIKGKPLDAFNMDETDFSGTSLENFSDSLLAIRNATDDVRKFLEAMSSYLCMVHEE